VTSVQGMGADRRASTDMAWKLSPQPHRVFERNPLVAVVVELRYHPILKVHAKVPDYQEKVRATFPAFQQVQSQTVNLGPAPVNVRYRDSYSFAKADESAMLSLSMESVSLESRRHQRREQLFADLQVGLDALLGVYGPIAATRLGLRYVDIVDRDQIERDLGRPTSWDRLISSRFLSVPAGLTDLDNTLFACEVASPEAYGAQTVRYGLVKDSDGRTKFRLDVDRYVDAPFESHLVVPSLGGFADDIFAVFMATAGPDLLTWMRETKEGT
jgi:uncharacterized protein (TIGR04255 family)